MDPLSPWIYGRRNARKLLPVAIILASSVTLLVAVLTTLAGLQDSMLVYTREFDHWTVALPRRETKIDAAVLREVAAHPAVERVVESRNGVVRVKSLIGPLPFNLRAVKQEELGLFLERTETRLREGRLPRAGTGDVALHAGVMKANGWGLGQRFGMEESEDDWMPGSFTVAGVLEGPVPLGLASFEYLSGPLYAFAPKLWERVLVVAKPGRTAEMNAWLRGLGAVKTYDKARAVEDVTQALERILLVLHFISATLIVVVSVVVGLLHNIFFGQRTDEFAILLAIGHAKRRLFRRVAAEAGALMAVSWAAGLGLAYAAVALFRALVLEPRGVDLPLAQGAPVLVSLALPAVALAFACGTVMGRLRRLDPVSIIERRG
jgi:hypothetical protein